MREVYKMHQLEKQLKDQLFIPISFPISRSYIEEAIEGFMEFLKEPEEVKNQIQFRVCQSHRRGDVGFTHRDPDESIYNDSKDYFHYHDAIIDHYPELLAQNEVVRNFFEKASPIWQAAKVAGEGVIHQLSEKYPFLWERFFAGEIPHIILRFIRYNWLESKENLAKPHFDAGSCTLAIAESAPGLRIGRDENSLKLVQNVPQEAIFFLSSNFNRLVNDDTFDPAWHDVIQLNEAHIGKPYARWALVCFFEAQGMTAISREMTHTCHQEKAKSDH